MKRIIEIIALLLVVTMLFSACGNMSMSPGNYNFKHVHFSDGAETSYCATVEKWFDNSTGIELRTTEYGAMYIAEGLYILFESAQHCPYCK